MGLRKLETISTKRQFFVGLLLAQFVLLPFASRNFDLRDIGRIVSVTLSNAPQVHLGGFNSLFQSLSLLMFILLFVSKDRMKSLFNAYVAVSYLAFAFIQNIALTEHKNSFDFCNFRWKYVWMMILALFAYWFPFTNSGQLDFSPLHFFTRNTATAFCLTTPAFLTILTLNLPKVNIVTYRITAIVGFIIGVYNMFSFFNPHTAYIGFTHLPLLIISLYCTVMSYRITTI